MKKGIVFFLLLTMEWAIGFSQLDSSFINAVNKNVPKVEHKIYKLLNKVPCLENNKDFTIYYIMYVVYKEKFRKEDFINHTFLRNIKPYFHTNSKTINRKGKYLMTQAFINDSKGNLIGMGSQRIVQTACKYINSYAYPQNELNLLFNERKFDYVLVFELAPINIFFGIKGNEICVIQDSKSGIKLFSVEEFVNCCWDTFSSSHNEDY
jgi:hypothetical protein